jgi:hypothetical protein
MFVARFEIEGLLPKSAVAVSIMPVTGRWLERVTGLIQ